MAGAPQRGADGRTAVSCRELSHQKPLHLHTRKQVSLDEILRQEKITGARRRALRTAETQAHGLHTAISHSSDRGSDEHDCTRP